MTQFVKDLSGVRTTGRSSHGAKLPEESGSARHRRSTRRTPTGRVRSNRRTERKTYSISQRVGVVVGRLTRTRVILRSRNILQRKISVKEGLFKTKVVDWKCEWVSELQNKVGHQIILLYYIFHIMFYYLYVFMCILKE